MSVTIQTKGGTAARWTLVNPVLAPREQGLEKHAISLTTVNAVARRIWLQTMYCESDR